MLSEEQNKNHHPRISSLFQKVPCICYVYTETKEAEVAKQHLDVAMSSAFWLVLFISRGRRKHYARPTFPTASNSRTISDGVQYFPFLLPLVSSRFCTCCTSSARPGVRRRLDMEMSTAADRSFLLMWWNLAVGHVPRRNKHQYINQSHTHAHTEGGAGG